MYRIHSKNIAIDGRDIHYLTGGQGSPLIIVHGGSEGAKGWRKTVAELARKYRVYAPDLPGWGRSQPLDGDYYIPELVEFVDRFAASMGLGRFYLMGHSMGGAIALTYTLKYPGRVEKLVLVSSLCLGREIALWVRVLTVMGASGTVGMGLHTMFRGVKWVVDAVFAPLLNIKFTNPISLISLTLGRKVANHREQILVLADRLCEVAVPTLVVWGARDTVLPVTQAYAAARLIPNCQVKVFEDCGHSVYRQRIPEFSRTLGGFLG